MSTEMGLPCSGNCPHENDCYNQVLKNNEACKVNISLMALPVSPSFVGLPDGTLEVYLGNFKEPVITIKDGMRILS